jgi:hypothetical protein
MSRKTKRRMSKLSCTKKCVANTTKEYKKFDEYKAFKREQKDINDLAIFFPPLGKVSKNMDDALNDSVRKTCKKRCAKK